MAAEEEKANGTAAYKRQDWAEAIECYTRALGIHDEEGSAHPKAVVHNRALAYLQSKDFKAALRDADEAISLDSTWYKPYSTKAYALSGLGRTSAAVACLMKGQGLVSEGRPKLRSLEKFFDGAGDSTSSGSAGDPAAAFTSTPAPAPGAASGATSSSSGSTASYVFQNITKTIGFMLNTAVLVFIVASWVFAPFQRRVAFGTYRYALLGTIVRHVAEMWNDPSIRPRALSKDFAARVMQSPWAAPIFFSLSSFFCKNFVAMLCTTLPVALHAGYGAVAYAAALEAHRGAALPGHNAAAALVAAAVTKLPDPAAATSAEWRALSGRRQWSKIAIALPASIAKLEVVVGAVAIVTLAFPLRDVFHTLFFWQYLRMRYMIAQSPQMRDSALLGAFSWADLKVRALTEHSMCPRFVGSIYIKLSGYAASFAALPSAGEKPSMCAVM
jgi:hypothetical protein